MLKLSEVLEQRSFGLRLLTGGDAAGDRIVEGAHSSEMPGPSQFLPKDWMMLTLGFKLRGNVKAQRALVAELDEARLSALGFGIGVAFEHVPRPILEEADRRGFPVFEIPFDTPYREIIGFVNRSRLSTDLHLVQRSLSMQNYLMDALRHEAPLDALVHRLGELLDSTVIMFNDQGGVMASSREAPFAAIWAEVTRPDVPSVHRALIEGADTFAIPIDPADHPRLWLTIASHRRALPRQLALSVIQTTERLLDLIAVSRRAAAAEERVLRAEVLASALSSRRHRNEVELRAQLQRFGLGFGATTRMVAIELEAGHSLETTRAALERLLGDLRIPYLIALRDPRLLLLIDAPSSALRDALDQLAESSPSQLRIGGGRPVHDLDTLPDSLRDADVALTNLARHATHGVLLFEEFDLVSWLIGTSVPDDLSAKAGLVLQPLADEPTLIETLASYLRNDMRVAPTAVQLNLHENSLRYRLRQIEKRLGRSLRDVPTMVDLYVAIASHETYGPERAGTTGGRARPDPPR